jgi:hypothetical protein
MKAKVVILFIAVLLIIVTILLVWVQQINYRRSEKLVEAIYDSDVEKVRKILNCFGYTPNTPTRRPWTIKDIYYEWAPFAPLEQACFMGNYEIVELLLKNGASPNYVVHSFMEGQSPLYVAVGSYQPDDYRIVKLLLDRGARANYRPGSKWVYPENRETVIEHAASMLPEPELTPSWNDGVTYIYHKDVAEDIVRIVDMLLENGASLDGKEIGVRYSLLENAVLSRNFALIEYLIEQRGMDVNIRGTYNMTALIYVAWRSDDNEKDIEMATLLLQYGPDKAIQDVNGKTAYDYAMENGQWELAKLVKP